MTRRCNKSSSRVKPAGGSPRAPIKGEFAMTNMLYKAAAITAVVAIALLAVPAPAEAGRGGRAVAAGVLGFAAGAIVAGSIANNRRAAYYDGYYDGYYGPPPRRVYYGPPPPWSPRMVLLLPLKVPLVRPALGHLSALLRPTQVLPIAEDHRGSAADQIRQANLPVKRGSSAVPDP